MMELLEPHLLDEVRRMHGDGRGYHDWSHPLEMFRTIAPVRHLLHDEIAFAWAIATHDVFYDPKRSDNEERSAIFAERRLIGVLPNARIGHVARMICATATHMVDVDQPHRDLRDTMYFLDCDLSILGADCARFDAYEVGIWYEYRHYPWIQFAERRAGILEKFLNRDRIYLTEWGHDSFDAMARDNLRRSIETLRRTN